MSGLLDTSSEFGARVEQRLQRELIAWLTTVTAEHAPLPRPVWFLWLPDEPGELLVYSRESPRIHNLTTNPRVTLNFDSDGTGGNIVVLSGEARVEPEHPRADQISAYVEKYAAQIKRLDHTPASFADRYHVAVRIALTGVAGH